MTTPSSSSRKVVTFYSYKGGTGRTMALANVAWILAANGYRVLAIDWDLEAPGLHRFFAPGLSHDPEQTKSEGLLDFLMAYVLEATRASPFEGEEAPRPRSDGWVEPLANLAQYSQPVETGLERGTLDFVNAGRQDRDYADKVNAFRWKRFYTEFGGRAFLDKTFAKLRESYDYIFIDSRTGVSDTSGICTVQLPDQLVVAFTLSMQGVLGASSVAADASRQRSDRPLRILPLPSRIDENELDRLNNMRAVARQRFAPVLADRETRSSMGDDLLEELEVREVPYYLYEERLAAVVEPGKGKALLPAYERLASKIADGRVKGLPALERSMLARIQARFAPPDRPSSTSIPDVAEPTAPRTSEVVLIYAREDAAPAAELRRHLRALCPVHDAGQVDESPSAKEVHAVESASVVVVFAASSAGLESSWIAEMTELAAKSKVSVISVVAASLRPNEKLFGGQFIRFHQETELGEAATRVYAAFVAESESPHLAQARVALLLRERSEHAAEAGRWKRTASRVGIGGATFTVAAALFSGVTTRQSEELARLDSAQQGADRVSTVLAEQTDSVAQKKKDTESNTARAKELANEADEALKSAKQDLEQAEKNYKLLQASNDKAKAEVALLSFARAMEKKAIAEERAAQAQKAVDEAKNASRLAEQLAGALAKAKQEADAASAANASLEKEQKTRQAVELGLAAAAKALESAQSELTQCTKSAKESSEKLAKASGDLAKCETGCNLKCETKSKAENKDEVPPPPPPPHQ